VKKEQHYMLYLGNRKKAFECSCGCIVFHRFENDEDRLIYVCNGCSVQYEGVWEKLSGPRPRKTRKV
jgi:hypothetical protein